MNTKLTNLRVAAGVWIALCTFGIYLAVNFRPTDVPVPALSAAEAREKQRQAAESLGVPVNDMLDLAPGITMKLALIPAGTFTMGTDRGWGWEGPPHRVTLSTSFNMGATEVTNSQWFAVMNTEPWSGHDFTNGAADIAATYISWDDATAFCRALSKKTGRKVRLPTEAEWEYACRAGTTTDFSFGDDIWYLGDYAWYRQNTESRGEYYAHPVGTKKPNTWGLYDMHGNVWEWCADWFAYSYPYADVRDPKGPAKGDGRVIRGGSWEFHAGQCRSGRRGACYFYGNHRRGFRVVVETGSGGG